MISLFVAHANDYVIGYENDMPWHLPKELAYFKKRTMGRPIVMGRKTFESIGRVLPGRLNVVITRNEAYEVPEGVERYTSIEEALDSLEARFEEEIMVIGGAEIFNRTIDRADKMYITKIDHTYEGDTFFPAYDLEDWTEIEASETYTNDEGVPYTSYVYERNERRD